MLGAGRFVVIIKVFRVKRSIKFPDGIKAKYLLKDVHGGFPRLLVDNHEPHGYHIHPRLPQFPGHRERIEATDHETALTHFMAEVERIIRYEKD